MYAGPRLQLTKSHLKTRCYASQRIARSSSSINAIVSRPPTPEVPQSGPLSGVSVAIKDNICTQTLPTTCSSEILRGYTPPYDATVVRLLREHGATIVGKTNCDEFGMGSLNVNSIYGPVINPFQPATGHTESRSAGGSSGGSAAAVAAGLCDIALGTDTGGSIRLPASYCGVVGFKPSYGLLSRWGVISYADSLDTVGLLSKSVALAQRVFNILNVHDPRDGTSVDSSTRREILHSKIAAGDLRGIRIGIPVEYFPAELSNAAKQALHSAVTRLKKLGAEIKSVSLPNTKYALSSYYVLASAEASSNMARYDGVRYGTQVPTPAGSDTSKVAKVYAHTRDKGFGSEVKKRIILGTYALSADAFDNYFLKALRLRQNIAHDFNKVFRSPNVLYEDAQGKHNGVDALVHCSAIRSAPPLASPAKGVETYVQDVLTVPASLAGIPALSIPAAEHADDGWPLGLSIVGQWGDDDLLFKIAQELEV